ncbi:TetR/AcrR family transcriptional regulator [Pseudonocardia adelaidensis]|uniref:TetR/AcrR family transcriptional regulator n=1 Tax=Pseudonocardia adelaidensis TaxID=648754 RepID=A0ABP9P0K9_9PSEU
MAGTKERIVATTSELFRRQGYPSTGLKQIVTEAGAPFGSIYHFFPGGKQQLAAEVIRTSGRAYQQLVEAILDQAPDAVTAVETGFAAAAETLVATDYADACPIATVALEVASTDETLRAATAEVFDAWVESGATRFGRWGFAPADARRLAIVLITSLEGAFVLCRAVRSTEALGAAASAVTAAVRAAQGGVSSSEGS